MMAFSIRELEHKNKELRERVKPMQQLREALARAQEKLEDSEAVTRDAHAARAEAALLGDTVRNLEARLHAACREPRCICMHAAVRMHVPGANGPALCIHG